MKQYRGKVAFNGIAIGKAIELKKLDKKVVRKIIDDIETEKERFYTAQKIALSQLNVLYAKTLASVGKSSAFIFDFHQMMLKDKDYISSVINLIETQHINAEYAVSLTSDNFYDIFASMEDAYMRERGIDIKDVSERVINVLLDRETGAIYLDEDCIIVADDLSPSDTVQIDKNKVMAFVTRKGSINSHTSILSRTLGIPTIVSCKIPYDIDGKQAIVNAFQGIIIVEPETDEVKKAYAMKKEDEKRKKLLDKYKNIEPITKSGKTIKLAANIGSVSDIATVLENNISSIGLFRSEFLYLENSVFPNENTQFEAYSQVVQMMSGRSVIIRTLDVGADKRLSYLNMQKEENPALGYRAIRVSLVEKEIFKTQLRAILRASVFGRISIMIPMINSIWEVKKCKELIKEARDELVGAGLNIGDVPFGIMIETPAAVMIADELAKEVDFFSIGTNDLTQYTLAVDRQNSNLEQFYDPHHKAILRMIKMVVDAAHDNEIWVGICGELASDSELTATFIEYGIDELSMIPAMILPIKKVVCELD